MNLLVKRHGQSEKTVEGREARAIVKEILGNIGRNILIPEPPFTGQIRKRALDTLREGRPIWDTHDENGQSYQGTRIMLVPKIIGVIAEDGTWHGDGPDPRTTGSLENSEDPSSATPVDGPIKAGE